MGGRCSADKEDEKCVENFDNKTCRIETSGKTLA
jgi:hypothetical protein